MAKSSINARIYILLAPAELEEIRKAAEGQGKSIFQYMRLILSQPTKPTKKSLSLKKVAEEIMQEANPSEDAISVRVLVRHALHAQLISEASLWGLRASEYYRRKVLGIPFTKGHRLGLHSYMTRVPQLEALIQLMATQGVKS